MRNPDVDNVAIHNCPHFDYTENVQLVISKLREIVDKPVIINDISTFKLPGRDAPVTFLGAIKQTETEITIWFSDKSPEETFVHEILHVLLDLEDWPKIQISNSLSKSDNFLSKNLQNYLKGILSSNVAHFELFNRMETDYELDLEKYYNLQYQQKIDRFNNSIINPNSPDYHFICQQDILEGINYRLWGEPGELLMEEFNLRNAGAYKSCLELYDKIYSIGFDTPELARKIAEEIKIHLIKYGQDNLLNQNFNSFWNYLLVL